MLQVKSIRKWQKYSMKLCKSQWMWRQCDHGFLKYIIMARPWLDCYLCMSWGMFRCSSAPTSKWSPAPADMPDSPIRPCCLRLTTLQPVKVKTNRVSARMMMMYFLTPSFFPPVYSTLYFLLVPVSAVHLPAADSNPVTGALICLNPLSSNPPHPSSTTRLPSSSPPASKPRLCEQENTQIHTYATKLLSGKPQQLQSHSHNETVTKLYPPIPLRVTRF